MSKTKIAAAKPRSLAKGLIAGCIGGLAGVLVKTFAERMFPAQLDSEPGPMTHPAEAADEYALAPATGTEALAGIRWGFGAAAGAAYGALVEFYPAATAKEGASFGIALEALSSRVAMPALSLSAEPGERAGEVTSHIVYGVTTEFVRKCVRKVL
jgi:putative membrane protein